MHYVYGDEKPLAHLNVIALWNALSLCIAYAIMLPLDAVQERIVQLVNWENVFYHWNMSDKYALRKIQEKCRWVVKKHFVKVTANLEFVKLCKQMVARILRIHDLMVASEDDVFHALERWLAFDIDVRAESALHLLRLVRLPTISDKMLLRVCRSPYFAGHNEFYQLLLEALVRRTEVRLIHAPRIQALRATYSLDNSTTTTTTTTTTTAPTSPTSRSAFKMLGVTDTQLIQRSSLAVDWPSAKPHQHDQSPNTKNSTNTIDYNRREDRRVLFEGQFPLRWYKSVRFRTRSPYSLLFSVVIPKWSTCRRRFISESRAFLNHKWSVWVDPFANGNGKRNDDNKMMKNEYDEKDYISIYLCCESDLGNNSKVDARVDFGLFVVSTHEEFGMERKICIGRSFKRNGQAMGFRRHIRRIRLHSKEAALYDRKKDELVVGAHIIAPHVQKQQETSADSFSLSRTSADQDMNPNLLHSQKPKHHQQQQEEEFRSESPMSPESDKLDAPNNPDPPASPPYATLTHTAVSNPNKPPTTTTTTTPPV